MLKTWMSLTRVWQFRLGVKWINDRGSRPADSLLYALVRIDEHIPILCPVSSKIPLLYPVSHRVWFCIQVCRAWASRDEIDVIHKYKDVIAEEINKRRDDMTTRCRTPLWASPEEERTLFTLRMKEQSDRKFIVHTSRAGCHGVHFRFEQKRSVVY